MQRHRDTRQRQLILETVRTHEDHPSADQIYIEARMRDSRISRGTVYRNLAYLAGSGEITHVKVPGADRYDCRTDFHYHLICTRCGAVSDAPQPYQPELDRLVMEKTGYLLERHRTIFEGLCPQCRSEREEARPD